MTTFGDTSGFLAFLDEDEPSHPVAHGIWQQMRQERATVLTTNYVILEAVSLLHHRFGISAVRRFREDVLPIADVVWVDESTHNIALASVIAGSRRGPSFVDCTSFEVMRRFGISTALAFDSHFTALGYGLPEPAET